MPLPMLLPMLPPLVPPLAPGAITIPSQPVIISAARLTQNVERMPAHWQRPFHGGRLRETRVESLCRAPAAQDRARPRDVPFARAAKKIDAAAPIPEKKRRRAPCYQ
jgi:hypothetical protein